MKCPFCLTERQYYETNCSHCKFPFEDKTINSYDYGDKSMNLHLDGGQELLDKLLGSKCPKRYINFNRGWFNRMLNSGPMD